MFTEENEKDARRSRLCLLWMMEALTRCNQEYLRDHPETPKLYESGIVYQPEFGTEEWQDIPTNLERGWSDCEDLACHRVAELREMGIPAMPYIKWRKLFGQYRFHALVQWPKRDPETGEWIPNSAGKIEDPSLRLGMKKWGAYLSSQESFK
jgi:hypothetical protein